MDAILLSQELFYSASEHSLHQLNWTFFCSAKRSLMSFEPLKLLDTLFEEFGRRKDGVDSAASLLLFRKREKHEL